MLSRRARIVATVLLGAFVTGGVTVAYAQAGESAPPPAAWVPFETEVIAHRGNTPAALRAAFANGADAVEFDVHVTKDQQLVVLHDGDLALNTTGCTGMVQQVTYSYYRTCHTSDGATAPNLYEALMAVRDSGKRAYVHVKSGPGEAAKYMKAVNKYGLNRNGHVVFYSSSPKALDELRQHGAASIGLTFNNNTAATGWQSNYPILAPYGTPLTLEKVRAAQARGQMVVPTESPTISLAQAHAIGVDGIMANDLPAAISLFRPAAP